MRHLTPYKSPTNQASYQYLASEKGQTETNLIPFAMRGTQPSTRRVEQGSDFSRQGDHRCRCLLADYYALLTYAAANLDKNTAGLRRALYERARTTLVTQMRKLDPPLSESVIRREQFALEEAIRKLEADKLSRLAQRDDPLIGNLNELVQNLDRLRQRMPICSVS